jgi:hypothetical protein
MRVLHADGAPGVMPHDVPLFDAALDTQSFDRRGHGIEPAETFGERRGAAEAGQIDGDAREVAAEALDHAVPQMATGGQPVQEEHGITRAHAKLVEADGGDCGRHRHPAASHGVCRNLQRACRREAATTRNMPRNSQKNMEPITPRGLTRA